MVLVAAMGPAIAGCDGGLWIERQKPALCAPAHASSRGARVRSRSCCPRARARRRPLRRTALRFWWQRSAPPPAGWRRFGAASRDSGGCGAGAGTGPAPRPRPAKLLPELLGNNTTVEGGGRADEHAIDPRHVYVIPPDTRMTVTDGHLRVRPASRSASRKGPSTCSSVRSPSEYREKAIGVVLSGSAHDGAAGIREIKAAGGIALVQEPE